MMISTTLNPKPRFQKSMQHHSPKPRITAIKVMILHTVGVQVRVYSVLEGFLGSLGHPKTL